MAWWHRVGQRVVCINDEDWRSPNGELCPIKGGVYTIREIDPSLYPQHYPDPCFWLEEIFNEKQEYEEGIGECSFGSEYFAPVKDTSIESLRALLDEPPDPALVREEADARFVEKQSAREKARMDGLLYLQLKSDPDLLKRMRDAVWRGPKG